MADRSTVVAQVIRQYLYRNEIPQKWLAAALKISTAGISTRLSGKRRLTLEDYLRICDALEVDYMRFLPEQPVKVKGRCANGRQE